MSTARPSVTDYGAKGNGDADDLQAFQDALDDNSHVTVPPDGEYLLDGVLRLNNYNRLVSPGLYGSLADTADHGARLVFTHTGAACFAAKDPAQPLQHCGLGGLTIRAANAATWIWDLPTLIAFKMAFVHAGTNDDATGGFKATKVNHDDSSWIVNFTDVEIRVTDTSTAHSVDSDNSDSAWLGGAFTGGKGVILRGTGGMRLVGTRVDRSSGYGVTISNETESRSIHTVNACQIEMCAAGGVLVDGDADDGISQPWCMPVITSNQFRNPHAEADVTFRNRTGPTLRGGTVALNSHNTPTEPFVVDGNWTDIVTFPGAAATTF